MQCIVQPPLPRLTTDKLLNNLELVVIARFESTGVVENMSFIIREDDFVLDVMHASLHKQGHHSAIMDKNDTLTSMVGSSRTWPGNEIGSASRDEDVPVRDVPMNQPCRSLDSRWYRNPSGESLSSPSWTFQ
jgi:hypothetical protein